jgi:hypothetical protein
MLPANRALNACNSRSEINELAFELAPHRQAPKIGDAAAAPNHGE